ncbi:hypothetical protein UQ64_04625 [Paenibacillus etheri]|uniref:Aminoglycoside phosphotransferase domain-containing protein n=1 Tax=Paenibacillus etheri TaxID=1306852 RepID=A0A0W1B4X9_9BACL|nr:hypothetical protein UQ64_04625 [Paenibacillus etheri]
MKILQMENAKVQLAYASQHMEKIGSNQSKLLDKLYELESRIQPRKQYGFIHGEMGPDHVLVNDKLEPFLIDIKGLLKLIHRGFPDQPFAKGLAEYQSERALRFIEK